jgi:hypothetical protein
MSEKQPSNQASEEIDLGQLFQMIGNLFSKFFKFIGGILEGLLDLLIRLLIFIKKHLVKLAIAGVVGIIVGFVLDKNKEKKYISSMVVEPNFNSVQQLYNNISFYNELAKSKDSTTLGNSLGIQKGAGAIKEFTVDSYTDENQKIKLFDAFVRSLDTTTQKAIDMEAYLKNFNSMDARFHRISVITTNSTLAKSFQDDLISGVTKNIYFEKQKKAKDKNLNLQEEIYKKQEKELDSLQHLYKEVMLKEAAKPMQGTSINMAGQNKAETKELSIIKERDKLKTAMVDLNTERVNKSDVVNVISNFPDRGVEVKGFWNSYKFLLPVLLVLGVFLFYSVMSLSAFLDNYKK